MFPKRLYQWHSFISRQDFINGKVLFQDNSTEATQEALSKVQIFMSSWIQNPLVHLGTESREVVPLSDKFFKIFHES